MKLTRRQLRELIQEMSFAGMPNIMRTQATGYDSLSLTDEIKEQDPSIDPDTMGTSEYRDKVEKYFRSPKYQNDAKLWLGLAFPDSNVQIVPYIGSEASAVQTVRTGKEEGFEELMKNPDLMKLVPQVDSHGGFDYRASFYDMSNNQNMLVNVGVDPSSIDLQNDIVLIPVASVLKKGFLPSIHTTIHTMFDNDLFSYEFNPTPDSSIINIVDVMEMLSDFDINNDEEREERFRQAPVTRAIRRGEINQPFDFAAEVITAYVFGYAAIGNLDRSFYNDSVIYLMNKAKEEFRNFFKGKIVIIAVA